MSIDLLPAVSIKPGRVSFYKIFEGSRRQSPKVDLSYYGITDSNDTNGLISKKANSRVRDAIDWMIFFARDRRIFNKKLRQQFPFKLAFITLTLSSKQLHSDQVIKKELLNHFLVILRQKFQVHNYLWRAEAQQNGNIHFHIVIDKFIPYWQIRDHWNKIQDKLGYVAQYSHKMKNKYAKGFYYDTSDKYHRGIIEQLKAYEQGCRMGWYQPNSTDIHSVKKIKNLSGYLAKYCAKNETITTDTGEEKLKGRAIKGKLWGLSNSLSGMASAKELCDSNISEDFDRLKNYSRARCAEFDYVTTFFISIHELKKIGCNSLVSIFYDHVKERKKKYFSEI